MDRPKRTIKKPKQIYEPDPNVKLEGDYSDESDFDIDDLSSGEEIVTSEEEASEAGSLYINSIKDEYQKDDFLVSDNDSLGELTGSDSEGSWHTSDEEELSEEPEDSPQEEFLPDDGEEQAEVEMDLD